MFYDKFKELCKARSVSVSKAATDIGLSNSTPTKWKNTNATPDSTTLSKIADYFGVTIDYLLGTEKEKAPTLTKKDERDIAKDLERIMNDLEHSEDLMFDGKPMSEDSIESLRAAMKLGLEAVKMKNKETYTPKKYRKAKGD